MKKRSISVILAICMLITMLPGTSVWAASHADIRASVISVLYAGKGGSLLCDFGLSGKKYDGNANHIHEGIDYRAKGGKGTSIYAIADGKVVAAKKNNGMTTLAIYNSAKDLTVVYLHLDYSKKVGDKVSRGDYIGKEGDNGNGGKLSTPHTHISIRKGVKYSAAVSRDNVLVNPNPYPLYEKLGYPISVSPQINCSTKSVSIQPEQTYSINYSLKGDGHYKMSVEWTNSDILSITKNTIDWSKGTGTVQVKGVKPGKSTLNIISKNSNNKEIARHTVTINVVLKLDTPSNYYKGDFETQYLGICKYDKSVFLKPNGSGDVKIADNSFAADKMWRFVKQSDGTFVIYHVKTGKVLDAAGATATDGTNVITYNYNGGLNQKWYLIDAGNDSYYIKSAYCNKYVDISGNKTTVGTNVQLWKPNGSTAQRFTVAMSRQYVKYNANGGSGAPSDQMFRYGNSVKLSSAKPTRSGYQFKGWARSANATSAEYQPGGTYELWKLGDLNVTLYAVWSVNSHTDFISLWATGFKYGEGNNNAKDCFLLGHSSFSRNTGEVFTLTSGLNKVDIPKGFALSNKWGSSSITSAWQWYDFSYKVTQLNSGMWFQYNADPVQYKITYNLNGGTNSNANPSTYNVLYGVTFQNPTRAGYTFAGWTDSRGNKITGINPGVNAKFSSYEDMVDKLKKRTTGNQTVTANWTANASPSKITAPKTSISLASGETYVIDFTLSGEIKKNSYLRWKVSAPTVQTGDGDFLSPKWMGKNGDAVTMSITGGKPGTGNLIIEWVDGDSGRIMSSAKVAVTVTGDTVFYLTANSVKGINAATGDLVGSGKDSSTTLIGDVNLDGKVTGKDVTRLRQYLKYPNKSDYSLSDEAKRNADVNSDGKISGKDVTKLRQHLKYPNKEEYKLGK